MSKAELVLDYLFYNRENSILLLRITNLVYVGLALVLGKYVFLLIALLEIGNFYIWYNKIRTGKLEEWKKKVKGW